MKIHSHVLEFKFRKTLQTIYHRKGRKCGKARPSREQQEGAENGSGRASGVTEFCHSWLGSDEQRCNHAGEDCTRYPSRKWQQSLRDQRQCLLGGDVRCDPKYENKADDPSAKNQAGNGCQRVRFGESKFSLKPSLDLTKQRQTK